MYAREIFLFPLIIKYWILAALSTSTSGHFASLCYCEYDASFSDYASYDYWHERAFSDTSCRAVQRWDSHSGTPGRLLQLRTGAQQPISEDLMTPVIWDEYWQIQETSLQRSHPSVKMAPLIYRLNILPWRESMGLPIKGGGWHTMAKCQIKTYGRLKIASAFICPGAVIFTVSTYDVNIGKSIVWRCFGEKKLDS